MGLPSLGFIIDANVDAARRGISGLGDLFSSLKDQAKSAGTTIGAAMRAAFDEIRKVDAEDAYGFMAIKDAAGELQSLGSQVQGITGRFLDESAESAGKFEGIFAQIAQKSGAADGELKEMRDKALDLGATTAHNASGVADVMKDLAADGFSVEEILEGTDKVLNLASAGEMKAAEAGLFLSDIFAGFKPNLDPLMSTGEAFTYLSDQMAMASDSTSLNVEQVARTFLKFGPVAADAGLSFSDASALVGAVSPVAKAEEAGTALKSIVTSTRVAASKEVKKLWAELGYNFEDFVDAQGQTDFLGILDFFRRAKLDARQVVKIFGKEFLPVANMLLSDEGFKSAAELMESQMGATGKTAEIAEVTMGGMTGAAASLEGAMQTLKIKLGASGLTDFIGGLDTLKAKAVKFVADLPTPMLTTITAILGLIAALGGLMVATGTALAAMSSMGLLLPKLKIGFTILKTDAIIPLMMTIKTFILQTIPSALATLPALIAGWLPVLLSIIAIVTLLALAALLIYKYWKPIEAFFKGFAEGFMFQWNVAIDSIKESFRNALAPLKELAPAFRQIKKALADLGFTIFQEQLETSGNTAKSWGKVVGNAVGFVVGGIVGMIAILIDGVAMFIKFGVALGEGFYSIYEFFANAFGGAKDFFSGLGFYFDVAKDEFSVMVTAVQSWVSLISAGFRLAGATVKDTLHDAWVNISSYGRLVREGFELLFSMLAAWAADLYSLYIAPQVDMIASALNLLKSEISLRLTRISTAIGDVFAAISGKFNQIKAEVGFQVTQAKQAFDDIFAAISGKFNQIKAEVGFQVTQAKQVLTELFQLFSAGFRLIVSGITYIIQPYLSFISSLWSGILSALNTYIVQPLFFAISWLWGEISERVRMLAGGVFDILSSVSVFVSEMFAGVRELLGGFFGRLLEGAQTLWTIVSEALNPAILIFQNFIQSLTNAFSRLTQAVSRFNPFGAGTGGVATMENRNNATNKAAAASSMTAGTVDTATAAGNTTAAVSNTTTTTTDSSKSVSVGNININAQDGGDAINKAFREMDRQVALGRQ